MPCYQMNCHPATNDPKGHREIGHRRGALLQKPSGVWAIGNQPNVHPCGEQQLLANADSENIVMQISKLYKQ
jgi:hypothetical protein